MNYRYDFSIMKLFIEIILHTENSITIWKLVTYTEFQCQCSFKAVDISYITKPVYYIRLTCAGGGRTAWHRWYCLGQIESPGFQRKLWNSSDVLSLRKAHSTIFLSRKELNFSLITPTSILLHVWLVCMYMYKVYMHT